MPHHKRAAAPQSSLSSIPSLFCFECSALASCTHPGTRAGKSALAKRALAGHRCSVGIWSLLNNWHCFPIQDLVKVVHHVWGMIAQVNRGISLIWEKMGHVHSFPLEELPVRMSPYVDTPTNWLEIKCSSASVHYVLLSTVRSYWRFYGILTGRTKHV